ncbi:MAG: hypothetical protein KatS3mg104_2908 [Phycisphaerae bacterium]|jgi:beta-glucanase (GH16 family)|nr:MAG: hypothetical protein KatS3mg104_2908 [Phycisphaerae bacterium]
MRGWLYQIVGYLIVGLTPMVMAEQVLLDASKWDSSQIQSSSGQVRSEKTDAGLLVSIDPGNENYPGISILPVDGKAWDLSSFGHVRVDITNTGDKPLQLTIRVDDDGPWQSNPWNAENLSVAPGKSVSKKVIFGYSWGYKQAHALKTSAVTKVMVYAGKRKEPAAFRIDSVVADGSPGETPPQNPTAVRIIPENGFLMTANRKTESRQLKPTQMQSELTPQGHIRLRFSKDKSGQSFAFVPPTGKWDLRQFLQLRVVIRNEGPTEVSPRFRLNSDFGNTDFRTCLPIPPGQRTEQIVPFMNDSIWTGPRPEQIRGEYISGNGGTKFGSDAVGAVVISVEKPQDDTTLVIESIRAELPEPVKLPDWVGKRPPVEGDWVMTFQDDFDSDQIDTTRWNYYGANYWDKKTRFSSQTTYVRDGSARLKFEKSKGRHNDDPEGKETDYATGYLDTYGKWVQRYGYFESRMKLPRAPGIWPAFWMMPDRGLEAGPQWKRQATEKDGMEFDIMEHLTRWGPYRYTIAMHWDGYGKNHKATGASSVYFNPDSDGYVTAGLLWLPGKVVYYSQGKEVARWETDRIASVPACLIFTLPAGGWDNNAIDDNQLPAEFLIDYVRVWQRKDLASEVDGPKTPAAGNELGKQRP